MGTTYAIESELGAHGPEPSQRSVDEPLRYEFVTNGFGEFGISGAAIEIRTGLERRRGIFGHRRTIEMKIVHVIDRVAIGHDVAVESPSFSQMSLQQRS